MMEMVLGAEVNGKLIHQGKDQLKKPNKSMLETKATEIKGDQTGDKVD
jgi:hypothetical protein